MSRQVGPYALQEEIARGGAGVVFRALDARDGRPVALKVMLEAQGDARKLLRFGREVRTLTRLRHPTIVSVFDTGVEAGRPWIAMELIEGASLQRHLDREGPMAPAAAAQLVATLARAVEHAHAVGVLHRDLKPDNVLIVRDGSPRLVDFGLARDLEPGEHSRLTATGAIVGTPGYWAPEQARGEPADVRTDVYGLGGILHAALVGAPPIEAESWAEALIAVEERDIDPPSRRREGVDPALDVICLRALAKARDARYPAPGALADALEGWLAGPRTGRARRRRPAPALVIAGAGAAVAVLLAAAALWSARARAATGATTSTATERPDAPATTTATEAPTPTPTPAATSTESTSTAPVAPRTALLDEARAQLNARAYAAADLTLTRLLQDDPYHVPALAHRGAARVLLGLLDEAAADARRAVDLGVVDARAWYSVGLVRLRTGDLAGAEAALSSALALEPTLDVAWRLRAEARSRLGRPSEALADVDRAAALAPDDVETLVARSNLRHARGDLSGAMADLEQALRLDPRSPPALVQRARFRRMRGEVEAARADLDQALALDERLLEAWCERAALRAGQGDRGALDDAERALALEPGVTARGLRAQVLEALGDHEAALRDRAAVARQRGTPDDFAALGECFLALRRAPDALQAFGRAATLDPTGARWARLSAACVEVGDTRGAIESADRALALDRRQPAAWRSRGMARMAVGDKERALADLDEALTLAPDDVRALEVRSQLRYDRGDAEGAVADMDRVIALGPSLPARAYYNRGVYRHEREPEEALRDYDRSAELDPTFTPPRRARVRTLLMHGEMERALADLDVLLTQDPSDADSYVSRASAYRRLGKDAAALTDCARALQLDPTLYTVRSTRAVIFLDRREDAAAIAELDQVPADDWSYPRARALRAAACRRVGRLDEALADCEKALAVDADEPCAVYVRGLVRRARGDPGADADLTRGMALANASDVDLVRFLEAETGPR